MTLTAPALPGPYYAEDGLTVHVGEASAVLSSLPPHSAQLVLTDPPYNIGIPYPGYDDRQPWDAYWSAMAMVLTESKRVLLPGGVMALLIPFTAADTDDLARKSSAYRGHRVARRRNGRVIPMLARWTSLVEEVGFLYEETITVAHSFGSDEAYAIGVAIGGSSRPRMRMAARALLIAFNETRAVAGRDGKWGWGRGDGGLLSACKNHWYVRPAWGQGQGHPTPMPPAVAVNAIRLWTNAGDLVVDPFIGSGTVLEQARMLGRPAIGCDISEASCAIAVRRLAQQPLILDGTPAEVLPSTPGGADR